MLKQKSNGDALNLSNNLSLSLQQIFEKSTHSHFQVLPKMAESNSSLVKRIEAFIKNNLIEDALNELERCISMNYHGLKKEVILLKSRCEDIRSRRSRGVIDFKEESIELNKIKSSIIDLLDRLRVEIEKIDVSEATLKERLENSKQSTQHKQWLFDKWGEFILLYLLKIGMVLGIGALIWLFVTNSLSKDGCNALGSTDRQFKLFVGKNQFQEAHKLIDSDYAQGFISESTRYDYKREIFQRRTDLLLKSHQFDSLTTVFHEYKFNYVFSVSDPWDYNREAKWLDEQIEKTIAVLCKNGKEELARQLI